ncbi:MAG: acyl-CoA thioesterase [Bacteroidetes bacterium QS_8_64_10]|nr:MAG: acyl-CoA thioesterase [Bacteroidetes bacterium QS_8_64_10]
MNQPTQTVSDSRCMTTEIVLPNDTNGLGNMMGGRLLHLMDKCASISAQRHARQPCVTASVDSVEFQAPIRQNEVVVVESQVNRAFRTSMEVELNVWAENPRRETRRKCNRAYYTFVAIRSAVRRREFRLVLSGRLDMEDAEHIKDDLRPATRSGEEDA